MRKEKRTKVKNHGNRGEEQRIPLPGRIKKLCKLKQTITNKKRKK